MPHIATLLGFALVSLGIVLTPVFYVALRTLTRRVHHEIGP